MAGTTAATLLRHKESGEVEPGAAATLPEPANLYCLIVIALFLHKPEPDHEPRRCRQCRQEWPCRQLQLACRLRDGF
jgi:hypothetical protein